MGYTVTVKPISQLLADKMVAFLQKYEDIPYIKSADDLSYCHKRGHIGFDYGAGSGREMCYVLIHWMMTKICKEQVYYYDGQKTKVEEGLRDIFGVKNVISDYDRVLYSEEWFSNMRSKMAAINKAWDEHV